ncbi:hypothetical protein Cgig2_019098 [Carnegiea gigantea]|uniref:Major facilitator superfamily (MFS) profile domain-containing protein n=1 Tax=Carnegiea gigantea TaxID=171969 RepID=A0A9Q1KF43_9CARY|nr:hypothetical protein Cgig2_019098 [Carnegiea gigantea]
MAIDQCKDLENAQKNGLEDLEAPLMIKQQSVKVVESEDEYDGSSIAMVLLSTCVAVCGSFIFGTCVGFSAPTQSAIREDLALSLAQAMRLSVCFCVAGWLAIYFARGAMTLDIGRLFSGYGIGVISYVVPIFIAEIAPKELRGGLTTLNQLLIVTGSSVTFLLGSIISWRALALTGLVPCVTLLSGLFFVPESPRWLIGVGLMVFQQCVGINGVGFYVSQTFVEAGLSSGKLGTVAYAVVQVPITVVGAVLMDRSGRKPLITISAIGTFLGCFFIATGFLFKSYGLFLEWVPILAVGGVLTYISAFSIGFGGVPWVIMSEIFPINVKGAAGSLVVLVNWSGAWLISYTYNFMMSWSTFGTYCIYAAFCILTVFFVAKVVPETKGKTLEEIQACIDSKHETLD